MTAAVAITLLVAYLAGAFEQRGKIRADDVCRSLPNRKEAAEIFNSVLPRAASYDFDMRSSPIQDWHYNSNCFVKGDGKDLLLSLHANAVATVSWQKWADHELPPTSNGKLTDFNAGLKGLSTPRMAAIYVPCYSSERESKDPWSLTVFAQAPSGLEGSDKEARQTLIKLATEFGRYVHHEAKCDLPSKLPS
ncbi:hypothetical protein [Streptomyces sp. NPDC020747]|uniref:hypothetical protein n=1 Tax=Streptomyces sp. NPDC020747 TaxID=3365086 RepID=UPI0037AB41F8